ncbi:MAG: hypothetical protein RL662_229 [Bacteroidota bacterium]|jgi:hypothetical protein
MPYHFYDGAFLYTQISQKHPKNRRNYMQAEISIFFYPFFRHLLAHFLHTLKNCLKQLPVNRLQRFLNSAYIV